MRKIDKTDRSNRNNRSDRNDRNDKNDKNGKKYPVSGIKREDVRADGAQEDLCWGRNPLIELLESAPGRCTKVHLSKTLQRSAQDKIIELCKEHGIPFDMCDPVVLDRISNGGNHQGVLAHVSPVELLDIEDVLPGLPKAPSNALVILADHIQDPHNLGAIVRSAAAAGALFVAVPKRRTSLPTGTVVKTSAGAALKMPIVSVSSIANAVKKLQDAGFWVSGLDGGAVDSLFAKSGSGVLSGRCAIVVGSEGKGLGATTAKACDQLLKIPMAKGNESLNASAAAAIALFEWVRLYAC